MHYNPAYGRGTRHLRLQGKTIRTVLVGPEIPAMDLETLGHTLAHGIRCHAPLSSGQGRVIIVVPDITRLWARGGTTSFPSSSTPYWIWALQPGI